MENISEQAGQQGGRQAEEQRGALEESQRKAAQQQPENYKEKATDDKVVEVGADVTQAPIRGIDPAGRPGDKATDNSGDQPGQT